MFRCEITNKLSRHGDPRSGEWAHINDVDTKPNESLHSPEKIHRIVVETRERVYKQRIFNEEKRVYEDVEVGKGWEIVREINATQEGADIWNSWSPEQKAFWVKNTSGPKGR